MVGGEDRGDDGGHGDVALHATADDGSSHDFG